MKFSAKTFYHRNGLHKMTLIGSVILVIFFIATATLSTSIAQKSSATLSPSVYQTSTNSSLLASGELSPPMITSGSNGTLVGPQNTSTVQTPLDERNSDNYENTRYRFNIQYPSGWQVREGGAPGRTIVVEFSAPPETNSDAFVENFNIGVQNNTAGESLDDYSQATVNLLQTQPPGPDFKLIQNSTSTTLGGIPAKKIGYTMALQNESASSGQKTNIQGMQVWTIKNDIIYVFSFAAEQNKFPLYLPLIDQIISTFRIT